MSRALEAILANRPPWWPEWTNYPHGSLDEWHARKLSKYCVWLEEQLLKAEADAAFPWRPHGKGGNEMSERLEIPACAAIRFPRNGCDIIFAGRRHADCLMTSRQVGLIKPHFDDQGFMTTLGRFVTRREARMLIDAAGIKSACPDGFRGDILFSEDLY